MKFVLFRYLIYLVINPTYVQVATGLRPDVNFEYGYWLSCIKTQIYLFFPEIIDN